MLSQRTVVVLLCVVLFGLVSAARRERKKKPGSNAVDELTERITTLEESVEALSGNNVHFFFHGGDDHEHDHTEGDQHVHVHIHSDDHVEEGHHHHYHEHVAICRMSDTDVDGSITMVQSNKDRTTRFKIEFNQLLNANTEYPIHVHQFGDISDSCGNVGGHYNPYHEGHDDSDIGTVSTGKKGVVEETWKNDTHLTLFGEHSIIGRSIVVPGESGNVCCAIGWSPDTHDHDIDDGDSHDHSMHDHDHDHDHDHSHDHH